MDERNREEAKRAKEVSKKRLRETEKRWDEVHRVHFSIRELRRENHLSEKIRGLFEGDK